MFYKDYFWKGGMPCGRHLSEEPNHGYVIVKDPYKKRISIERFKGGKFDSLVYDSNLFDFRKLKPEAQTAWQKIPLFDEPDMSTSIIKDQDDRTILIEISHFKDEVCILTESFYPNNRPISRQDFFYKALGDTFNGVLLQDIEGRPILFKEYDAKGVDFQNVLQEVSDFETYILPKSERPRTFRGLQNIN